MSKKKRQVVTVEGVECEVLDDLGYNPDLLKYCLRTDKGMLVRPAGWPHSWKFYRPAGKIRAAGRAIGQ